MPGDDTPEKKPPRKGGHGKKAVPPRPVQENKKPRDGEPFKCQAYSWQPSGRTSLWLVVHEVASGPNRDPGAGLSYARKEMAGMIRDALIDPPKRGSDMIREGKGGGITETRPSRIWTPSASKPTR